MCSGSQSEIGVEKLPQSESQSLKQEMKLNTTRLYYWIDFPSLARWKLMVDLCIFLGVGWKWSKIGFTQLQVVVSVSVAQQRGGKDKSGNNP